MRNLDDYPFEIRPLTEDEGGGFLITYPDFNTCMSDGETVEEAIANGKEALAGMINALKEWGQPVPAPNSGGVASGKFLTRVPKSLHAALTARAKTEGVSLNTLVLTFIAEGIGQEKAHHAGR
ncbi:MAG: type II toxin-antitoxin system HicB family antitoxin [Burkholderiales bacterium]|nr:type II toxin-antitoxin system HicB family antitoxin [Burkholderiales bacterium]